MASGFLTTLLNGSYPSVFGNAMTLQEAQDANRNTSAVSVDTLRQQYDAANQAAINAANLVGSLQGQIAGYNNRDYEQKMDLINRSFPASETLRNRMRDMYEQKAKDNGQTTLKSLNEQLASAQAQQAQAQKNANRSLNQYLIAQKTAASRPASMQQAVNWGQLAKQAEANVMGQAADMTRGAIANENARMSTLSAHPLLAGLK